MITYSFTNMNSNIVCQSWSFKNIEVVTSVGVD